MNVSLTKLSLFCVAFQEISLPSIDLPFTKTTLDGENANKNIKTTTKSPIIPSKIDIVNASDDKCRVKRKNKI